MSVATKPLHPHLGAEVVGVDLRQGLTRDQVAGVVAAINTHAVLIFRHDGEISDENHLAFARAMGPLQKIQLVTMLGKSKTRLSSNELIDVSNLDEEGRILAEGDRRRNFQDGNRLWHTDVSFDANRAVYSMLAAHKLPPDGGPDTEFADMRAAYDALPDAMKSRIEGLVAEHDIWYSRALGGLTEVSPQERATRPPARHKLVHVHPRSGRKALYLASHIAGIVGVPQAEARSLLQELTSFATQPRFVYAHKWREGDLVMWDNLATMHRANPFEDFRYARDMRRATTLERAA
jgi:alpha-ketoglutarate-dependent 2,4-dichlorophenoxyacetate dioxygenase